MGLSVAYGPVGTDKERLKVVSTHVPHRCGHWLTLAYTADSGCRLRFRVHLLGHRRRLLRQQRPNCEWYARVRRPVHDHHLFPPPV